MLCCPSRKFFCELTTESWVLSTEVWKPNFRQYGEMKKQSAGRRVRREKIRRKKMQVREKVGKSRNTVFFHGFVAPDGWKVGSLKRRVRRHPGRWEMKSCTPLWREARFKAKLHKTPHVRTAFGSWDVEKVHAVVARSTFRSQNVQNTTCSRHFWRFRCRFASLRVITLHYTLHYTTVHYTTLHSTTLQLQLQNYTTTLHYIKLQYTTPHYTTLHYTTLHYTTLYTPLHYATQHNTLHSTHYSTLHYTTLHNTTTTTTELHNYTPPHSTTHRYTKLHYTTLHYTRKIDR